MLERRRFLAGLTGLICAPAIVRAASIMPVRSFVDDRMFVKISDCIYAGPGGSDFVIKNYDDAGVRIGSAAWINKNGLTMLRLWTG